MKFEVIDGIRHAINQNGDGWAYNCESCENWCICSPTKRSIEPCEKWHPDNWDAELPPSPYAEDTTHTPAFLAGVV
jgi:hypothetical protein